MRRRAFLVPIITLAATLAGVEIWARVLHLDSHQAQGIAIATGAAPEQLVPADGDQAWLAAARELDGAYLPRVT